MLWWGGPPWCVARLASEYAEVVNNGLPGLSDLNTSGYGGSRGSFGHIALKLGYVTSFWTSCISHGKSGYKGCQSDKVEIRRLGGGRKHYSWRFGRYLQYYKQTIVKARILRTYMPSVLVLGENWLASYTNSLFTF